MKIKVIAIDDEPPALEVISHHCEKISFVELQSTFFDVSEAMAYLNQNKIDMVFLDIEMPEIMGTDLAKLISEMGILIVFVTAHPQYAITGFELAATDYLLKPVSFSRFLTSCNRVLQQIQKVRGESNSLFVKDGYDWVKVETNQIAYIQSDANLLMIYMLNNSRVITRMTMSELLDLLPNENFRRIHKSFIVALDAVQKIERHQLTVNNKTIPMAAAYRAEIEKLLLK